MLYLFNIHSLIDKATELRLPSKHTTHAWYKYSRIMVKSVCIHTKDLISINSIIATSCRHNPCQW